MFAGQHEPNLCAVPLKTQFNSVCIRFQTNLVSIENCKCCFSGFNLTLRVGYRSETEHPACLYQNIKAALID